MLLLFNLKDGGREKLRMDRMILGLELWYLAYWFPNKITDFSKAKNFLFLHYGIDILPDIDGA